MRLSVSHISFMWCHEASFEPLIVGPLLMLLQECLSPKEIEGRRKAEIELSEQPYSGDMPG